MHPSLVILDPIVIRFSQQPQRLCLHFLFFWRRSLSSAFHLVVHQPWNEETNTCPLTYNPFVFDKIGSRADANIHQALACRYTLQMISTRLSKNGPMVTFASTHFSLMKGLARKVWRQCVLVFCAVCDLRPPRRLLHGYETHRRATTFPPEEIFVKSLSTDPSASRNTFSVSTITDGYVRAGSRSSYLPLRRPDCTSSRLRAEENDRPVTKLIAIPAARPQEP